MVSCGEPMLTSQLAPGPCFFNISGSFFRAIFYSFEGLSVSPRQVPIRVVPPRGPGAGEEKANRDNHKIKIRGNPLKSKDIPKVNRDKNACSASPIFRLNGQLDGEIHAY
jgi:hypothetical protein